MAEILQSGNRAIALLHIRWAPDTLTPPIQDPFFHRKRAPFGRKSVFDKKRNIRPAMIEIIDLNKKYVKDSTELTVLKDLSLTVDKGEIVALMGPSGVGKTTVLNIVAGMDTEVDGTVKINDVSILDKSGSELDEYRNTTVGFIFQEFNLLPHLNALENVIMPLMFSTTPHGEAVERGKNALNTVGLGNRMYRMPSELSGGQKQRIAIARALISGPKVILADEPTANLDAPTEQALLELIFNLTRSEKVMTLISTHHRYIADQADKIIELSDENLKNKPEEAGYEEEAVYKSGGDDNEV
jgi:putative ABC transport system ATP-binding protein